MVFKNVVLIPMKKDVVLGSLLNWTFLSHPRGTQYYCFKSNFP